MGTLICVWHCARWIINKARCFVYTGAKDEEAGDNFNIGDIK